MINELRQATSGMTRLTLQISGSVQGVGLRYTLRQRANVLGLAGFARNNPDGTVIVVAEGPRERLQAFLYWCYTGVRIARIDKLTPTWGPATDEFQGFSILT